MKSVELTITNLFGIDFAIEKGRILTADELWSVKYIVDTFLPSSEVLMAEKLNASAIAEKNLKDCPLTVEEKAEMFIPEFPVKNRDKRAKSRDGKALEGRKHKRCKGYHTSEKPYNKYCKEMSRKISKRNFKEHWQEELPEYWDACDQWYDEEEEEQSRNFFPHGDYICDPVRGYDCPENRKINEYIGYIEEEEELDRWGYMDLDDYDETEESMYEQGFEAGKQYVVDLLKEHGIIIDLDRLDAVK